MSEFQGGSVPAPSSGSNGDVLTLVAGQPTWQPAGGGGGGDQLATETYGPFAVTGLGETIAIPLAHTPKQIIQAYLTTDVLLDPSAASAEVFRANSVADGNLFVAFGRFTVYVLAGGLYFSYAAGATGAPDNVTLRILYSY